MKGVLILAHGSRENETEKTMDKISEMVRRSLPDILIETAYLQFRKHDLKNGLQDLIRRGADEIRIIPYFLFSGVHIRQDIPAEIDAFLQTQSGVKITLGGTLGADPRLADIIVDHIRQTL